jgi:hypothetical protein
MIENKLEQLRLITALGHATHGSAIYLTSKDGKNYLVSDHASSDFSFCEIRRMISISSCPSRPDFTSWIDTISVGGSIEYSGGGIYRSKQNDIPLRVFSTLLRPEMVFDLLDSVDIDGVSPMPVDAILNPDPILGVTTITISVDTSSEESELDELALIAYSACLVKEMSLSLKKHQSHVSSDNDENSIR